MNIKDVVWYFCFGIFAASIETLIVYLYNPLLLNDYLIGFFIAAFLGSIFIYKYV